MRRILMASFLLAIILAFGTVVFMLIEKAGFVESLYMTVITIAAVGYDEVVPLGAAGRIFTIFLIFIGVGFVLFLFREITEVVIEGGLRATFGRMKMKKKVARLKGHFIVCGYGRIGKVICKILAENNRSFVIIEKNPLKIQAINDQGYLVLEGEASDDLILKDAGIDHASGLMPWFLRTPIPSTSPCRPGGSGPTCSSWPGQAVRTVPRPS